MTQFLAQRRNGIGGSDAAAILCMSPYSTPLSVYLEKTSFEIDELSAQKQAVFDRGRILEPFLKSMFERNYSIQTINKGQAVHQKYDFIRGHVDGVVESENAIVEFKTADNNINNKNFWGEELTDQIPTQYLMQIHHYLLVMDSYEKAYVPVLYTSHFNLQVLANCVKRYGIDLNILDDIDISLKLFVVQRNAKIEKLMINKYLEFWQEHVIPRIPPKWTTYDDLLTLFPCSREYSIVADEEMLKIVNDLKQKTLEISTLEKAVEADKTLICNKLKDATELVDQNGKKLVSWSSNTRKQFDTSRFKEQYQELATQFYKTISTRTFRTYY